MNKKYQRVRPNKTLVLKDLEKNKKNKYKGCKEPKKSKHNDMPIIYSIKQSILNYYLEIIAYSIKVLIKLLTND